MIGEIVVIEPSLILRKGILVLLKKHFKELKIVEGEVDTILNVVASSEEKERLLLLSHQWYLANKELLEKLSNKFLFLSLEPIEVPHIDYNSTNEDVFVQIIEKALDVESIDARADGVLTESELHVLKGVASGLSNKEIATKLFLSIHTVTTHRKNITRKLDIKSVAGLTVYAILHELVTMNDVHK